MLAASENGPTGVRVKSVISSMLRCRRPGAVLRALWRTTRTGDAARLDEGAQTGGRVGRYAMEEVVAGAACLDRAGRPAAGVDGLHGWGGKASGPAADEGVTDI